MTEYEYILCEISVNFCLQVLDAKLCTHQLIVFRSNEALVDDQVPHVTAPGTDYQLRLSWRRSLESEGNCVMSGAKEKLVVRLEPWASFTSVNEESWNGFVTQLEALEDNDEVGLQLIEKAEQILKSHDLLSLQQNFLAQVVQLVGLLCRQLVGTLLTVKFEVTRQNRNIFFSSKGLSQDI